MHISQKLVIRSFLIAVLGLLLPLLAMLFSDAVNWTLGDFAVAGILLFGAALILGNVLGNTKKSAFTLAISVGVLLLFLLLFFELAVGIFGTSIAGS